MNELDKILMREFVIRYIDLCNEYGCDVTINAHGVHCIQQDSGDIIPFATVYPEWNEE